MRRLVIVVVVAAALGGSFLYGLLRGTPDRDVPSSLIGKSAPDFTLPLYERYAATYGDTFRLSEHRGSPMVINFWASWCGPCFEEAPILQDGWQRWKDRGVLFLGIQTLDRDKYDDGRAFLTRFGYTFPVGMDNDSSIGVDYALFGVPETYFLDGQGNVVFKKVGPVTPQLLDEKIGAMVE